MRTIVGFSLLSFALALTPAKANTANELLSMCEKFERGMVLNGSQVQFPSGQEPALCWGYLSATQDLTTLADTSGRRLLGVCAPAETTLTQHIRIFTNYARTHPAELHLPSQVVVLKALRAAFPC